MRNSGDGLLIHIQISKSEIPYLLQSPVPAPADKIRFLYLISYVDILLATPYGDDIAYTSSAMYKIFFYRHNIQLFSYQQNIELFSLYV